MSTVLTCRRPVPVLSALVALAACAGTLQRAPDDAPVQRIAIIGDMPYDTPGESSADSIHREYDRLLARLTRERLDFTVHVGDITFSTCTDSLYADRLRDFAAHPRPLIYTFGDNEWTDCGAQGHDPIERLDRLRALFTVGNTSLGQRPFALLRQSDQPAYVRYRENARWTRGGIVFVTLHVVGSNNNRGRDTLTVPTEFADRTAANVAWLADAVTEARRTNARGLAIFMHANPGLTSATSRHGTRAKPDGFREILEAIEAAAAAFDGPIALVHGDTHYFRVDHPFYDPLTRRVLPRVIRAETFGSPNTHAVLMTVDPRAEQVFSFTPLLSSPSAPSGRR